MAICEANSKLVVLEEHSIYGGLGSVLAEIAAERMPICICRIGMEDRFSEYCGLYDYLLKEHGLDHDSISKKIHAFISS